MTNNYESVVIDAIADTIVSRTNLLPVAHISAPGATANQSLLVLDTVDGFVPRGYLHFFDNTGEAFAGIQSVSATIGSVALNYAGYQEHGFPSGFQYDHATGALVATNLMLHQPMNISAMLATARPVVCIWPIRHRRRENTMGSTIAPVVIHIQVHMSTMVFDSDPMDPEAYNKRQQEACREALKTIEDALDNNRHLMSQYNSPGNHAQGLGDGKNPEWSIGMFDVVTQNVEIPQAVAAMEVVVRPMKFVRSSP